MPVISSIEKDKTLLVPNIEEEDPVTDTEVLSDRNYLSPILSHGSDSEEVYVSTEEPKPACLSDIISPKNIQNEYSEESTDSEHFDNTDNEDILVENNHDADITECYFEDNEFHERVAYQSKSSIHKSYNHKQMQSYICQAKKRRANINMDSPPNDNSSDEEKCYRDFKQKCRKKKHRRHPGHCKRRNAETHTDEEELRHTSSASDQDDISSRINHLRVGNITDSEECSVSDLDNILPPPVQKQVSAEIPEPEDELIEVAEKDAIILNETLVETDEEGFNIDECEDSKPLKRKLEQVAAVPNAPLLIPVLNTDEVVFTDSENILLEEKDEEDILDDMYINIESDILAADTFSFDSAIFSEEKSLTKPILSVNKEVREPLTDTEEIDKNGKTVSIESSVIKALGDTDSDSVEASDDNIYDTPRHPLVSQLSEIHFVESKGAPVTIIVTPTTPDIKREPVEYKINGVKFFDDIEQEGSLMELCDIEKDHDGTDSENFDMDELPSRPETPLPPENFSILPIPVREMIRLTEDEYGASTVNVEKLYDFEEEEHVQEELTDSEDADMSEADFNGIIKWDNEINVLSQLDEITEVTSKCRFKKIVREKFIRPIQVISRMNRLTNQNISEESNISVPPVLIVQEVDDYDSLLEPGASISKEFVHTDCEDFEMSGNEDVIQPPIERNSATPDALRTVPLKRTIICSEKAGGGTKTEICEYNVPKTASLIVAEEQAAITDTEEIEIPGEDKLNPTIFEEASLPEAESQFVYVKERANIPFCKESEELNIKNSYLLPEHDSHTDVESLNEDGNRA